MAGLTIQQGGGRVSRGRRIIHVAMAGHLTFVSRWLMVNTMEGTPPMSQEFGPLLRSLRVEADVSLGELARHLSFSVPYLSDVERGTKNPLSTDKILEAARRLNVDPTPLLRAAIADRHSIEINLTHSSPKAVEVGAALMRGWADLDDDELNSINEILGRHGRPR